MNKFILFIIILFFIEFCLSDDCPKIKPIKKNNNECDAIFCTEEEFESQKCIILNEKAKIQWLNNLITYKNDDEYLIDNLGVTIYNNDILLSAFYIDDQSQNSLLFFNINNNKKELDLKIIDDYNNDYICNFNSEVIPVQKENELNDYILLCCENFCDLFNYANNDILFFQPHNSPIITRIISNKNTLFKLNDNNYFYGSIYGKNSIYHLAISKFNFNSNENNTKILNEQNLVSQLAISCFQTENNLIQCLIVNKTNHFNIFLFEDENLNLIQTIYLDDKISNSFFYSKCIHLEKNIGIYYYFHYNLDKNPPLKIKNLLFNQIENEYTLNDIVNNSITINLSYEDNYAELDIELLKISNTRFIILNSIIAEKIIIVLCDLYGSNSNFKNIIIRYYIITCSLYDLQYAYFFKGFLYKDFIGFSLINDSSPLIIILGYNINVEPDTIININNINDNNSFKYIININDYLNNNIKITNNLFGYEFIGIKIVALTGISSGIKYYINSNDNNEIKVNDILNLNDEIIIDYSKVETKINNDFYLELEATFGEPEYDKFNSYADKIEIYGNEDQRNYFRQKNFISNNLTVKYNFGCHKNCDICEFVGLKEDNQKCTTCKNNEEYCYMNNNNNNNCFNIKKLTYNYYNKIGTLICIPLNENCPDEYPYENKNTKECKESISFEELISDEYIITNTKEIIDNVTKLFNEQIKNKKLNITDDIFINGKNITFHITSQEKQKEYINNNLYINISSIDLNECENVLKDHYHINESLIIFKIDIKRKDTQSTQVEYEVINPKNGDILNISICKNIKINLYVPVTFNKNTYDLINHLKEQGYDIFNPNDSFYNDICAPYNSINNTDIIIIDRKNDFYDPNLTLCEATCEYKGFNVKTSKVTCECETKTEIKSDISETSFSPNILLENFYSFENYTNYKVMKCYDLAFNFKKLKKNIGSYFIIFILLCFIVVMSFNFSSQYINYEEKFNQIIYYNFLIGKNIERKKNEKGITQNINKKINLTEPKDNDKNNNRMKLSFIDIDNINDLMSDNNNEKQNNNIYVKKRKSQEEYSTIKDYTNEDIIFDEPSVNSIRSFPSIKSPKKMNNMYVKINNLETGSEMFIENIISLKNNRTNNNMNNKNKIKKQNNKNRNVIKKKSFILDLDSDKDYINRKFIKVTSNETKLINRTINSQNSIEQLIDYPIKNEIKINHDNYKNNNKLKKKISKSKTLNFKKDKNKTIFHDERIKHILKNIPKNERSKYFIDNELNNLEYKYAVSIDFRTFSQYYWSLLKQTHPIIFTFITKDDYNLYLSKIGLFIMLFALTLTINALFFTDNSMHKLYRDYGNFDLIYNIPQTLYSSLISGFLSFLLQYLSLSEETLLKFKENGIDDDYIFIKKKKEIKCLIIKSIIFFIIGILLLLFFWYYLSCFCAVYYNTQLPLIKDTFISFSLSLLYPFPLTLIPTFVRIPSLRKKSTCLYKISRILTFVISLV